MSRNYVSCNECKRDIDGNNSASCVHDRDFSVCVDICYVCWYKQIRKYENNDLWNVRCYEHNKSCEGWVEDNYNKIVVSALHMLLEDKGLDITDLLDTMLNE
jgi:hypothetical protein